MLCAKRIVAQYFEDQYSTAIIYPRDTYKNKYTRDLKIPSYRDILISDIIIKELTYELFRDAVVWYMEEDEVNVIGIGTELSLQFIVVLSDYAGDIRKTVQEFGNSVLIYLNKNNLRHRAKLIIFIPTMREVDRENFYTNAFRMLSISKIYNVVVMSQPSLYFNKSAELTNVSVYMNELYSWFPYQNHYQCGEVQEITLLDRWIHEGKGKFELESNLFPKKIQKSFQGCTVVILQGYMGPLT